MYNKVLIYLSSITINYGWASLFSIEKTQREILDTVFVKFKIYFLKLFFEKNDPTENDSEVSFNSINLLFLSIGLNVTNSSLY